MHTATLKRNLEAAISRWDRRNKSHHAGALALLRLDECMAEIEAGADVRETLCANFNDRLLTALLAALPLSAADLEARRASIPGQH